ncbi:MAG: Fur family transcriptional regulator [Chloroflexota bacterium]|nr:Fur family transcriptional regulator [Chloroflexota bacterium]
MSCEEVFFRRLREKGFRLTPQREMVLSVLHDIEDFATAEEIHEWVSAMSSSVDISTVYRALELLEEFHMVAAVDPGEGQRRYELLGLHGQHFHLVCRSCGKIIGVDPEAVEPFATRLKETYGFEMDVEHLSVPGLCHDCLQD